MGKVHKHRWSRTEGSDLKVDSMRRTDMSREATAGPRPWPRSRARPGAMGLESSRMGLHP